MHSLLQTEAWARLKKGQGWNTHKLTLDGYDQPISFLDRELALGKRMIYAPEVGLSSSIPAKDLKHLAEAMRRKVPQAIFLRFEVLAQASEIGEGSLVADLTNAGFIKAFEEVQPEHRQWIDISGDETTILASMKEKGRYNVRLAGRKGVTTRISQDTKDIEVFYNIFKETAERDGFSIRSQGYFHALATMLFEQDLGELVIAEHEGQPLAALIITYYDGLASYLYGASSNQHRNLMAPYAAHFAAIQSAKKRGCTTYDLLQVKPPHAEGHKYAALTRFKEQFGGQRVDLIGSWDYVYQPVWYQLFTLAEKLRRRH